MLFEIIAFQCLVQFSHVQLFATPWTVACQAPLFMGFSRQEYWTELLCPPPGDLLEPGAEPMFPVSLLCRWILLPTEASGKPIEGTYRYKLLIYSTGNLEGSFWNHIIIIQINTLYNSHAPSQVQIPIPGIHY